MIVQTIGFTCVAPANAVIFNGLSQLRGRWPEESKACLVWFETIQGSYFFTIDELREAAEIKQKVSLGDGGIYTIERIKSGSVVPGSN